jgi:hypothetical protein
MQTKNAIPREVAAIIPYSQLMSIQESPEDFTGAIQRLEKRLQNCPKIGGTDGSKEHPALFHYFYGATDIFICEYDGHDTMFGFTILNGDLDNAEWGYSSVLEIRDCTLLDIDFYFEEQSIEAARHRLYPDYFRKPKRPLFSGLIRRFFVRQK